jgi:hypothetical protein
LSQKATKKKHFWVKPLKRFLLRHSPQIKPAYCYTFSLKNSVLAIRNAEIVCGLFLTFAAPLTFVKKWYNTFG